MVRGMSWPLRTNSIPELGDLSIAQPGIYLQHLWRLTLGQWAGYILRFGRGFSGIEQPGGSFF